MIIGLCVLEMFTDMHIDLHVLCPFNQTWNGLTVSNKILHYQIWLPSPQTNIKHGEDVSNKQKERKKMLHRSGVHTVVDFSNSEEGHNFPRKVAVCCLITVDSWTKYIFVYTKVLPTPFTNFITYKEWAKLHNAFILDKFSR